MYFRKDGTLRFLSLQLCFLFNTWLNCRAEQLPEGIISVKLTPC